MPDESNKVMQGQAVWTGSKEPHGMINNSDQEALYLVISVPIFG